MLIRNVEIASFSATLRIGAVHHRRDEPSVESQPWLELRGRALESVKSVTDMRISLWPKDKAEVGTARSASVGPILGAKPELAFGITWPQQDFDRLWSGALSGHLKYTRLYFTKPHYNRGLVVNPSFGTELEE